MTAAPSRRQLPGPRLGRGDDTGSLVIAMLLTLVGVLLSALMLPIVVGQIESTRDENRQTHALNAAQAGLDVALGHVRAANDGAGAGVLAELPCGPLTGGLANASTARYQVTIDYFAVDPQGRSDSWIAANRISCLAGSGTFSVPNYALFRSEGTNSATGSFSSVPRRSLRATYTFQTTNQNVAGGLVHVYRTSTSTDLCLDAGSGAPAAGTNVQMQPCSSGSVRQKFAYNTNLTLVLVASKTAAMPLGMCLDAGATPHATGRVVQFQPCASTTSPRQQWSINDSANFEGTANGISLDGYCFNVQTPNTAGSFVILATGSGCHGGYNNIQTFSPDASVGAGAAGAAVGQLVNFDQFGRCLDVTEQNVGYSYLISWPCKQAPNQANVTWNQKWTVPTPSGTTASGTGRITTSPTVVTPYCLRSPGSTAAGQYVTVALCPVGSTPQNMTWTAFGDTGTYATSYRIVDGYGNCLAPTDPDATPADLYPSGQQISKIVVAPCTGSTLQKWNAPPNLQQSTPLKDIGET